MHRSRLSTLLIDVPGDHACDAAAFWSAALGVPANPVPGEEQFTSLPGAFPGLVTAIQAVDDEPRYRHRAAALRHRASLAGRIFRRQRPGRDALAFHVTVPAPERLSWTFERLSPPQGQRTGPPGLGRTGASA